MFLSSHHLYYSLTDASTKHHFQYLYHYNFKSNDNNNFLGVGWHLCFKLQSTDVLLFMITTHIYYYFINYVGIHIYIWNLSNIKTRNLICYICSLLFTWFNNHVSCWHGIVIKTFMLLYKPKQRNLYGTEWRGSVREES